MRLPDFNGQYADLTNCHPSVKRGRVWCTKCGRTEKVDSDECFRSGWPKCCGYTMTIDSPTERNATNATSGEGE